MEAKEKYVKLIISAMKEKGLSNYRVAKDTNMSESGIGRIVKGSVKPNTSTLIDLLSYLGIEHEGLEDVAKPSKFMEELVKLRDENTKLREDLEMRDQIIKMMLSKNSPSRIID